MNIKPIADLTFPTSLEVLRATVRDALVELDMRMDGMGREHGSFRNLLDHLTVENNKLRSENEVLASTFCSLIERLERIETKVNQG